MKDNIEIVSVLTYLILRRLYLEIHPRYAKFKISDTEYHYQNLKTGRIHSQYKLEFEENSFWRIFNGKY